MQQEQEAKRLRFNPPAPPPAVLQPGRWALPEAMRRRADAGALAGRLREENRKVRLTHHMEAGAAPVVDQVWGRIRPETREWMAALGWNEVATLAALADLDPAGHWMVLRRARGETEKWSYTDLLAKGSTEAAEEFAAFLELVECAGTEVRARRNRVLEPLAPPPVADLPQEVVEERTRAGLLLKQVARARTVKAPKWSGGRVGKQGAGPAKAMTKREKLKAAALAWLRRTLEEMEAPIVKIARASSNPEGIWARAGGGRRPSTLHQRRGAWKKVREYYWTRFRKYWMPGAVYFLDYLNMRAAEPCARSVPVGAIAALAVLEDCGGWEKPDRISLSTVVKGTVRDATGELARRLGLRAIKRASRILVMVEIAMELYQGQAWRLPFKLWWCRIVLAMIWGGLRLSDHGGMPPNEVRYGARGLSAKLLETKTTGPGYRVEELMVWICREAYFVDPSWEEGFAASTKAYATEREFLVTVPKKDFEGHHAEARVDWARGTGLLHALLAELPLPVFDEDAGVWTASPDQKLFTEAALAGVAHTTVHSPRNAVISRAAMLGWSKDDRRMAARHKPEASEEYVRTQRAITERMQTSIAERVRLHGPGSPDVFDEEAALEDLGKFLTEREVPPEAVKEQLERLRYFDPWRRESTVLAPRARNTPGGAAGGAAVRPELLAVPGEPQTAAATGAPAEGGGADDGEEDAEVDGEKKWSSPAGGLEDLDLSDVELPADPVGYVVTKPRLTLHYVGACWRRPYVDYYAFEEFGLAPDREVQYVRHCSQCWPDGCIEKAPEVKEPEAKEMRNPFDEEPEDDSESDEDGSSGSSSPSPDEEDGTMEE